MASPEAVPIRMTGRLSRNDVLWVANTAHGAGGHWHARVHGGEPPHDHLRDAADARGYLAAHHVPVPWPPPSAAELLALRRVRSMVQGLVEDSADPWPAWARARLRAADFGADQTGRVAARSPGWAGFVDDCLLVLVTLTGERAGLGRCGNPSCRLVFLDESPNHRRRWCDSSGCGNRARTRRARTGDDRMGTIVPAERRRGLWVAGAQAPR